MPRLNNRWDLLHVCTPAVPDRRVGNCAGNAELLRVAHGRVES